MLAPPSPRRSSLRGFLLGTALIALTGLGLIGFGWWQAQTTPHSAPAQQAASPASRARPTPSATPRTADLAVPLAAEPPTAERPAAAPAAARVAPAAVRPARPVLDTSVVCAPDPARGTPELPVARARGLEQVLGSVTLGTGPMPPRRARTLGFPTYWKGYTGRVWFTTRRLVAVRTPLPGAPGSGDTTLTVLRQADIARTTITGDPGGGSLLTVEALVAGQPENETTTFLVCPGQQMQAARFIAAMDGERTPADDLARAALAQSRFAPRDSSASRASPPPR